MDETSSFDNRINLDILFPKKIDFEQYIEGNVVKFFFFGCWNDNLDVTQRVIENICADETIQFGIVNGDNYYRDKSKKQKKKKPFSTTTTDSEESAILPSEPIIDNLDKVNVGFNVLKRFDKTIYLTLGNHEVDSEINEHNQICGILLRELEMLTDSKIVLPHNYYSVTFICENNSRTKIVFLDVNLLNANTCYNDDSRLNEMNKMLDWLVMHVKNTPISDKLIIVGHNPLFHTKKDKLSNLEIKQQKFSFVKSMRGIFDFLVSNGRPVIYLASDTHNYQYIKYKNITEIIVGTAGASLDDVKETSSLGSYNESIAGIDGEFEILRAEKQYGHLVVTIGDEIQQEFVSLGLPATQPTTEAMAGGSKLTDKYLTLYNKYAKKIQRLEKLF